MRQNRTLRMASAALLGGALTAGTFLYAADGHAQDAAGFPNKPHLGRANCY